MDNPNPYAPILIDVYDVAKLLDVSVHVVRRELIGKNGFPNPIMLGKHQRWRRADIVNWVDFLAQPSPPPGESPVGNGKD